MIASVQTWKRWAVAIGLGAVGGLVFHWLDVPLAWMLGAMAAATLASLSGVPVAVPAGLRDLMIAVLALMLGGAFHPGLFDQAGRWAATLSSLALYVTVVTAAIMVYYRTVAGFDPVTSYFAAAPGGLNEMIMLGSAYGGDDRTISLIHALRILLVVFVVPIWYRLFAGYSGDGALAGLGDAGALTLPDIGWLVFSALSGYAVASLLRFPAARMTGPMFMAAALHITGVTDARPPGELVAIAQVVLGTAIGCRFAGIHWRAITRTVVTALGSTAVMLILSLLAASFLATHVGVPATTLMLAFVPGGLAEMCLIAVSLGADVAFVSTHHFARIVLVVVAAPIAFRLGRRWIEPVAGHGPSA